MKPTSHISTINKCWNPMKLQRMHLGNVCSAVVWYSRLVRFHFVQRRLQNIFPDSCSRNHGKRFSFEEFCLSGGHQMLHYHGSCNFNVKFFFQNESSITIWRTVLFLQTWMPQRRPYSWLSYVLLLILICNKWKLSIAN